MADAVKCPVCNGGGKVAIDSIGRLDTGEGSKKDKTCHGCSGSGWVRIK